MYDATAFAARRQTSQGSVRPARFDIVVLVETTSPTSVRELQATSEFQALRDLLSGRARRFHAIAARNAKPGRRC